MAVNDLRNNMLQEFLMTEFFGGTETQLSQIIDTSRFELGIILAFFIFQLATNGTLTFTFNQSDQVSGTTDFVLVNPTVILDSSFIGPKLGIDEDNVIRQSNGIAELTNVGQSLPSVGFFDIKRYIQVSVKSNSTAGSWNFLSLVTQKSELMPAFGQSSLLAIEI